MKHTDDAKTALWAAYQSTLAEACARLRVVDDASNAGAAPMTMEAREALRKRNASAIQAVEDWRAAAKEWFDAHGIKTP